MAEIKEAICTRDLQQVEALASKIWHEHYTPIIGKHQVDYMLDKYQTVKAMEQQIKEGSEYFLILNDSLVSGYIGIRQEADHIFLSKVYVEKEQRGRKLGKAAIEFMQSLAIKRNTPRIILTVNKNNTDSIAVYEKMGFEKAEAIVMDIGGGFVMDDFRMILNLS